MRLAVAGSALLVLIALAAFWYASTLARKTPTKADGNAVTVTIRGKACDPNQITVPAGHTTFTIVNKSDRALEWEILDGVMVVAERENIAPGFSQRMTVKLRPGKFDITCGLLSNPHGTLTVTPSNASRAEAARPSLVNYIGALAEYKVYLTLQTGELQGAAQSLDDAIKAGDLAQARALYGPAHQTYRRIEPMAALFSDLDTRINARAQYFEKREADPGFTGLHRIEYSLYVQNSAAGLAPVADRLVADIGTLEQRLAGQSIQPSQLAGSAATLLRRLAGSIAAGGDGQYSHDEPAALQGTLDGTRKIASLLAPLLAKAAPALQKDLDRRFTDLDAALAPYREGEHVSLDKTQRDALAGPTAALAKDFGKVNAALGLE